MKITFFILLEFLVFLNVVRIGRDGLPRVKRPIMRVQVALRVIRDRYIEPVIEVLHIIMRRAYGPLRRLNVVIDPQLLLNPRRTAPPGVENIRPMEEDGVGALVRPLLVREGHEGKAASLGTISKRKLAVVLEPLHAHEHPCHELNGFEAMGLCLGG